MVGVLGTPPPNVNAPIVAIMLVAKMVRKAISEKNCICIPAFIGMNASTAAASPRGARVNIRFASLAKVLSFNTSILTAIARPRYSVMSASKVISN